MRLPLETPDATHPEIHAYILGAGITSLSAAVHLLQEGHLPASHIHILETLDQAGGGTVSSGNAEEGYHYRAGGMPLLNGDAMATLFAEVPSDVNPGKSVLDDLYEYWGLPAATAGYQQQQQHGGRLGEESTQHPQHQQHQHSQCHQTRLIRRSKHGLVRIDYKRSTNLGLRDRVEVFRYMNKTEVALGRSRIQDHFGKGFFGGSYWGVLSTTFGFKSCHSAAEFHRTLHKFGHDIASITSSHPRPLDGGQYNRHESLVAPIARFLRRQGVDFQFQTTVTDIIFADDATAGPEPPSAAASNSGSASASVHSTPSTRQRKRSSRQNSNDSQKSQSHLPASTEPPYPPRLVSAIIAHPLNGPEQTIPVQPHDIVLVSLGSAMSGSSLGSNTTAPPLYQMEADHELDENWLLWLELTTKDPRRLGNAYNFCTRLEESRLESFTITLRAAGGNRILERITGTNNNTSERSSSSSSSPQSGSGMFVSLIDAPWVVSLHVPAQPVFPDQPAEVQVLWGYALYPERTGEIVRKPMLECTGEEILREVLAQLEVKEAEADRILQGALTIPCVVPRMAAGLLPRGEGNRPRVIPPAIRNLGLIGQFVEIEGETGVAAMEYSVLGAQMAVRELVGRGSLVLGEERKGLAGEDKGQQPQQQPQQQHRVKESRKRSWLPLPCT
ncbi:67 kDa myosin-cross-reactive antigen like protein [Aspergillus uvarum CBS 121591]|uniref:67 kDa myosin-cross-reactive antigen like protein n=1 Tax=Aspergillus uvarum CBS 121591 TaxID=1448315 RepID=A0A319BZ29_9EURO|nr:67 kDa myosin-cross-reactive antigen like protein [Aspergillus uvarum CBS 121591]PYH77387.1 67 kDa myosin-cross-reactive antigen like protein [Aspergillus uvarum CBS 121591]